MGRGLIKQLAIEFRNETGLLRADPPFEVSAFADWVAASSRSFTRLAAARSRSLARLAAASVSFIQV